ncbi:MAG TPA: hypothetical protein VJ835_07860 [Fimbriimonadaceae bacterium]|nr:hypothetical protein [Fimbriimonadaceae bacterium]
MPKYIHWYLVEVESQVRERLRIDHVHTLLQETEQHLTQIYSENLANGMSDEDAQLAALQRFGPVSQVTGRASKGGSPEERDSCGRYAVGSLIFGALVTCATVAFAPSWTAWSICLFACIASVIAFGIFALLSRKMLIFPIAVVVLTTCIGIATISAQRFIPETSILRSRASDVVAELERYTSELDKDLRMVDGAETFFKTAKHDAPYWLGANRGYVIPLGLEFSDIWRPVGYLVRIETVRKGFTTDWTLAKSKWHGSKDLRNSLQSSLNYVRAERNRILSFAPQNLTAAFRERVQEGLIHGAGIFLSLVALNGVVFAIGRISKKRPGKTWLERRLAS